MNWHYRYLLQAGWTRSLRSYLFDRAHLSGAHRVLEVGCGTGAVLGNLSPLTSAHLSGLDLSAAALCECRQHAPAADLTRGNARSLPYPNGTFELTYCHFLLLWVGDPLLALKEMKRVTRASGYILVLAEPDYSKRTDRPEELIQLGAKQNEALRLQGASLDVGSHLADLFHRAAIRILETGQIQSRSDLQLTTAEQESEWAVLETDLARIISTDEIAKMRHIDRDAWARGTRLLNVPTYFAWGQV